jgi:hypothetical protein
VTERGFEHLVFFGDQQLQNEGVVDRIGRFGAKIECG